MHNLAYFQKCFMRQMEEIKQFPKSSEQKFGELEMALSNISEKNRVNYIENSQLLLELLKNRISSLEKVLIEKDANISYFLKQKNVPDIRTVNYTAEKTVTETCENNKN